MEGFQGTDLSSSMQTEGMQVQVSGLEEVDWASPELCVAEKAVCPWVIKAYEM